MGKALRRWRLPILSLALLALAALWVAGVAVTVALAPGWATRQAPSIAWAAMVATLRDVPDAHDALVERVVSATPRQHDVLAALLRRDDRLSRAVARAVVAAVDAPRSEWLVFRGEGAADVLGPLLLIGAVQRDTAVAGACRTTLDHMRSYRHGGGRSEAPGWHALVASHVAIMTRPELGRLTSWLATAYDPYFAEGSGVIALLEGQLGDPDPVVARAALSGLCWRGSAAIGDRLVEAVADDDSTGMTNAWLSQVRDPAAGTALARMLAHADRTRRLGAVIAIARCRAVAQVPDLLAALDRDATLREPILLTLAELRDRRALAAFAAALHDDEPMMRLLAARGLSGISGDDALAALRAGAVDDPLIASVVAQRATR
ncbi:MAG TPA: HEAT repeat domain-containing protein [Planctomycetota bacterium]|nr:HEAT repeat domain-containing protein [Planctomycetota bacterium]